MRKKVLEGLVTQALDTAEGASTQTGHLPHSHSIAAAEPPGGFAAAAAKRVEQLGFPKKTMLPMQKRPEDPYMSAAEIAAVLLWRSRASYKSGWRPCRSKNSDKVRKERSSILERWLNAALEELGKTAEVMRTRETLRSQRS